jgi:hypothetical protein
VPPGVERPADLAAYRAGRDLEEVFAETQRLYESG